MCKHTKVWAFPFSLAATKGINNTVSVPPLTKRFRFSGCASTARTCRDILIQHQDGFPHSETSGSKVESHFPGAYRRLSTSFVAAWCQGIHRIPLWVLTTHSDCSEINQNIWHHKSLVLSYLLLWTEIAVYLLYITLASSVWNTHNPSINPGNLSWAIEGTFFTYSFTVIML